MDAKPVEKTDWGIVTSALVGGVVAALHVGKVPAAILNVREELGLGLVDAGFVISTFSLLGMCLGALIGTFSEALGRRRVIKIGMLCLIAGGLIGAFSGGIAMLLASRILEGLGFLGVAVAMPSLISVASSERDRALTLSIWSVFTPAGFAIALLMTPPALESIGWRGLWLSISALTVIAAIVVTTRLATLERFESTSRTPTRRLLEVLCRPRLLLLALALGSYTFQWVTLMAWLPTFLVGQLKMDLTTASVATAIVVAANVPGNVVGGELLRRGVKPSLLIVVSSAIMAFAMLLILGVEGNVYGKLFYCLVFSAFGGTIPACLFTQIPFASPSPGHLGPANGLLMQGSSAGQFVGPPIVAASIAAVGGDWAGAVVPMFAAAALTVLASVLAVGKPAS